MYLDEPDGIPNEAFVPQLLCEGSDVMVSGEKVLVRERRGEKEGGREREREGGKERERQGERRGEREGETGREKGGETGRDREREGGRDRGDKE
jgi:hypothetical protein